MDVSSAKTLKTELPKVGSFQWFLESIVFSERLRELMKTVAVNKIWLSLFYYVLLRMIKYHRFLDHCISITLVYCLILLRKWSAARWRAMMFPTSFDQSGAVGFALKLHRWRNTFVSRPIFKCRYLNICFWLI